MVSRGGRSLGCSQCRQRRVKCDETRPICNRCKKRGVVCDGPKPATWINQNETFYPPSESTRSTSDTLSNGALDNQLMISPQPTICDALSLSAFQDDIYIAYTRKTLLRGGAVEVAYNKVFLEPENHPAIDLLRDALFSLAITFFGSQHHQDGIKNRGYAKYGAVLRNLNLHLTNPDLQTTDETILAALTCMVLESFLPTGPHNFLKHMRGIESILEIRGPPTLAASECTKTLFRTLRILSIVSNLSASTPSLYARDEWRLIPWLPSTDEAGRLRHEIFTILADCTFLKSELEIWFISGDVVVHESLLKITKLAFNELEAIFLRWLAFNKSILKEGSLSKPAEQLQVGNHVSATIYMLYNTAYICLLDILESLEPSPHHATLRSAAAVKILKALELKVFEQQQGANESNTIGFIATKVAWQSLGGFNSPEGRKLARVVKSSVNGVFAAGAWEDVPHPSLRAEHGYTG